MNYYLDINKDRFDFEDLKNIISILLGENGCPWDRAQTHKSVMIHLLEECYEVIDAVNNDDKQAMCEELGDVLLQVVFNARLAQNKGSFSIDDVIDGISRKMINRHTHVFGSDKAADADEALVTWEENKTVEKSYTTITESMENIPKILPALMRAQKIVEKAQKTGLDNSSFDETVKNAANALNELTNNVNCSDKGVVSEKMGQYLLENAKISAFLKINAEFSLTNASEMYINRIKSIEST